MCVSPAFPPLFEAGPLLEPTFYQDQGPCKATRPTRPGKASTLAWSKSHRAGSARGNIHDTKFQGCARTGSDFFFFLCKDNASSTQPAWLQMVEVMGGASYSVYCALAHRAQPHELGVTFSADGCRPEDFSKGASRWAIRHLECPQCEGQPGSAL